MGSAAPQSCSDSPLLPLKQHLNQFAREHQSGGWLGRTLKRFFG